SRSHWSDAVHRLADDVKSFATRRNHAHPPIARIAAELPCQLSRLPENVLAIVEHDRPCVHGRPACEASREAGFNMLVNTERRSRGRSYARGLINGGEVDEPR